MNKDKLALALRHWETLDADERLQFSRQCMADGSAGAPFSDTPPSNSPFAPDPSAIGHTRPRRSLPLGSGQRNPRVPVIPYDPEIFRSEAYRRLAANTRLVHVYAASCEGTRRLYEATRTVVYKVGTHAGTSVLTRIASLSATAYASWRKRGPELVEEPGWTSWRAERLPIEGPRLLHSPVAPLDTSMGVRLPSVIPVELFDLAVSQAMLPLSLARLRQEPRVALSLVGLGCDPDVLERYTARLDGAGHKLACELVRIQPRRDAEALASMAEGIIASLAREHL